MTKDQIIRLSLHWGRVIKVIFPDIEFVPKGAGYTLDTLLSNWDTGPLVVRKPTEAELLSALQSVEWEVAEANNQRQAIIDLVQPAIGLDVISILTSDDDAKRLLIGILGILGAIDEQGNVRPSSEWMGLE